MPVNINELLLHDVQTVFQNVNAANANDILDQLREMANDLFNQFELRAGHDLWIKRVWDTGPEYGYLEFPEVEPAFLDKDGNPAPINPHLVQLDNGDQIQDAFKYLFTSHLELK